jgi:hypothetical protein
MTFREEGRDRLDSASQSSHESYLNSSEKSFKARNPKKVTTTNFDLKLAEKHPLPAFAKIPIFSQRIIDLEKMALALEQQRKEREDLINIDAYFKDTTTQ